MYSYKTSGVCARTINFGKPAEEIISILKGTTCGKRPTSCPDQLARALQEAIDAL